MSEKNTSRNLRVLVLSGLDRERFYGQSTRPYYLSRILAQKGCAILHICPNPPHDPLTSESFLAIRGGYTRTIPSVVKILIRSMTFHADIIHAHQIGWTTKAGRFLAVLLGKPLVVDVHGLDSEERLATGLFNEEETSQMETNERKTLRVARKIVVVSDELGEYLRSRFEVSDDRIVVIPNGVDVRAFKRTRSDSYEYAIRDSYRIPEGNKLVTFTCPRIESFPSNEIALKWFFRVIPIMRAVRNDVTYLIVGGGKEIIPPCKEVIYTGFVGDLQELLSVSDVCVLPYPSNAVCGGVRNKALEYFAVGKPVVSTTEGVRGISDAVPGRDFLLAEDAEMFAKATLDLLASPSLARKIGSNGAALAERYDWSIMGERLIAALLQTDCRNEAETGRAVGRPLEVGEQSP